MTDVPDLTARDIYLDAYPPTRAFAVISWGAAATAWLAKVLDAHPDVFCVHAANRFWHAVGGVPLLDGAEYLRLLASQGHAYAAAGDVHGVSRERVPELRTALGERFRAAVVVREPLARLNSQFALFDRYKHLRPYDLSHVAALARRLGIPDDDYDRRLVVHGINMLNVIEDETAVGPVYRSEALTTDPVALARFVGYLTADAVDPDPAWCADAVRQGRVNNHRATCPPDAASVLPDDVIPLVREIVTPRAWELYSGLGYEVPAFVG